MKPLKMGSDDRLVYFEAFGITKFKRANVLVPLEVTKKMELIYLFMYKHGMSYHFLLDLVMTYGLMTFVDLIEEYKVTSFFQMLKLLKLMKRSMRAFVENAKEIEPIMTLSSMRYFISEMNRRKLSMKDQIEFMNYIDENYKNIIGETIMLSHSEFDKLLTNWIIRKVKVKEI